MYTPSAVRSLSPGVGYFTPGSLTTASRRGRSTPCSLGDDADPQIPAPNNIGLEWISTDPNGFNAKLEAKNVVNDYQTKPTIRLLKYWSARKATSFNSCELEQWVVNNTFISSGELRKYFFEAVQDMQSSWAMPQWTKEAIQRAKEIVQETKRLEEGGYPPLAENEIKKLIPEPRVAAR